jgi:hypothetical protein
MVFVLNLKYINIQEMLYFLTQYHAMEVYWGNGSIYPPFLDLGIRWRSVVSFTPRPLYPQRKSPWYLLDRRLGRPQSRSGLGGEEKNSQPLPGLERPIIQPVAQRNIILSRGKCMLNVNLSNAEKGSDSLGFRCK